MSEFQKKLHLKVELLYLLTKDTFKLIFLVYFDIKHKTEPLLAQIVERGYKMCPETRGQIAV